MFDKQLMELGLVLPQAASPAAHYIPTILTGKLLFIAGQLPIMNDGTLMKGKLGDTHKVEYGQLAARHCALNLLAQIKASLGSLDQIERIVKLTGFINSTPSFFDSHLVMNGASALFVDVFGEQGKHTRSTIGAASLPLNACVEIEAIVEIK